MRPCIEMAMMRRQKTHPTATLAHQNNTPKQVRSIIRKKN